MAGIWLGRRADRLRLASDPCLTGAVCYTLCLAYIDTICPGGLFERYAIICRSW